MEAHLAILLGAVKHFDLGQLESDDEIYVWWGKVRSPNRRQPLGQLDTVLAIGAELEADESREGHLYLTDYRALYVGHVVGITRDDVRRTDGARVPDYYAEQPPRVRLLVQADGRPPPRGRRHAGRDRRAQAAAEHELQRPAGVAVRRDGGPAADRHPAGRNAVLRPRRPRRADRRAALGRVRRGGRRCRGDGARAAREPVRRRGLDGARAGGADLHRHGGEDLPRPPQRPRVRLRAGGGQPRQGARGESERHPRTGAGGCAAEGATGRHGRPDGGSARADASDPWPVRPRSGRRAGAERGSGQPAGERRLVHRRAAGDRGWHREGAEPGGPPGPDRPRGGDHGAESARRRRVRGGVQPVGRVRPSDRRSGVRPEIGTR